MQKEKIIHVMENDDEEGLKELLSQNEPEIIIKNNKTPLIVAVENKKPRLVDIILRSANVNVNAVNCFGQSSLYSACNSQTPCIETIAKLLMHKADVNLSDVNKITPLMIAASYGNVQVMSLLIEDGAKIDVQDAYDRTAVIYAIRGKQKNSDGLIFLLNHNAKVSFPTCSNYNPLVYAIYKRPEMADILMPFCKYEKNFSDSLTGAILTNRADIFQKLLDNGAKLTNIDTHYMLTLVISEELANVFDLLWRNINQKFYLKPKAFISLFNLIFNDINETPFFMNVLNTILDTPDFNCNLNNVDLVIKRIFYPKLGQHDWNLCKDTLLKFCEYINRQGVKLTNSELVILIQYFHFNCSFRAELLAVFLKNDPELIVTVEDVTYFSCEDDLNLTSQLLYNCSHFYLPPYSHQSQPTIYGFLRISDISEEILRFYLQRFTPTKSDTQEIRYNKKFDHIDLKFLKVPSLKEVSRNALRLGIAHYDLKQMIRNLFIPSAIQDIIYFKSPVNCI